MRAIDASVWWFAVGAATLGLLPSVALAQDLSPTRQADVGSASPGDVPPPAAVPASPASAPSASPPSPQLTSPTVAPAALTSASAPSAFPFLALRPAPPDIAGFPARLPSQSRPDERGVEVHGFVAAWVTPWSQSSPNSARDAYRLRFGVLRIDARPLRHVTVLARLGLMVPSSPLLDFALTYTPYEAVGVTVGQFRLPIGAAATTLAPQLVLLDRPNYVYAMTKLTFRDVGVMIHSSPRGIGNGVFHYRLVAAGGGGRAGVGVSRAPDDLTKTLIAARALVDLGRFVSNSESDRLALGATYLRSRDPALATGDPARDRELAVNLLGRTLTPIGLERVTQLAGTDLTFVRGPFYSQAELLYLHSEPSDGSARHRALGTNLDLAYTLPLRPWDALDLQLAARGEHFDPRAGSESDDVQLVSLGLNAIAAGVRGSVFATLTFFDDATTGVHERAGELTFRASAAF